MPISDDLSTKNFYDAPITVRDAILRILGILEVVIPESQKNIYWFQKFAESKLMNPHARDIFRESMYRQETPEKGLFLLYDSCNNLKGVITDLSRSGTISYLGFKNTDENWQYGLAAALGFTEVDTSGHFITPIDDSLHQSALVTEEGGLNNWSIAVAIDIGRNLSLGGTLTFVAGSYGYERKYQEEDRGNLYEQMPDDLAYWTLTQTVHGDISGIPGKMGLMYRVPDLFRLGIAVKFPTQYWVKEDFGERAESFFDNGDILPVQGPYQSQGYGEYEVVTP